jgi:DHA1 family bicyclomycin/chloramphenicol resistance-like MFS transporter
MLSLVWWLHPLALFGPMVLFAIGNGISLPNGTAGAVSVDPTVAGTAAGFAGFLQMGLGAAGSLLAGWTVMGASSQLPLVLIMIAASLIGFVSAIRMLRRNRTAEPAIG